MVDGWWSMVGSRWLVVDGWQSLVGGEPRWIWGDGGVDHGGLLAPPVGLKMIW
jgi:hypothetical protein